MPRSLAIGQAANFQSLLTQYFVSTPWFSNSNLSWTFSSWVNVTTLAAVRGIWVVDAAGPANAIAVNIQTNGTILVTCNGFTNFIQSNTAISTRTWAHIVVTYNGTILNIYINGTKDTASAALTNAGVTLTIGGLGCRLTSGSFPLNGLMDAVKIFSRVWSQAEVTADYNVGVGLSAKNLVVNSSISSANYVSGYDFDTNGLLVDAIGTNTLTNNGGVTQVTGIVPAVRTQLATARTLATARSPAIGQAAAFNSSLLQYLSVADNAGLRMAGAFSVSGWAYVTVDQNQVIAAKYINDGRLEWQLQYASNTQTYKFWISSDGGAVHLDRVQSSVVITRNGWYHVVATFDGVSTASIRINDTTTDTAVLGNVGIFSGTAPFTIGAWGDGVNDLWSGLLDAVAVWKSRVLTAGEITQLYRGGVGLACRDFSGSLLTSLAAGYDFDQNGLLVDVLGVNTLTNNNGVTQVRGIVPARRTLLVA